MYKGKLSETEVGTPQGGNNFPLTWKYSTKWVGESYPNTSRNKERENTESENCTIR